MTSENKTDMSDFTRIPILDDSKPWPMPKRALEDQRDVLEDLQSLLYSVRVVCGEIRRGEMHEDVRRAVALLAESALEHCAEPKAEDAVKHALCALARHREPKL